MDYLIQRIESLDLGGSEMTEMLKGHATVKMYKDLAGATLGSFFSAAPAVALLFPVASANDGHWLGIWVDAKNRTVHHFDSYGFGPDAEIKFSQDPIVKQCLLQKFYLQCTQQGYQIKVSTGQFQQMNNKINTCGRHVITRLRLSYLPDPMYERLMLHQHLNPDQIVTYLCFLSLNADQKDDAHILHALRM